MTLYVALDKRRQGLLLSNHNTLFFLPGMNGSQLSETIAKQLESQGVSPAGHAKIVEQAEVEYEMRVKVDETVVELKRLMAIRLEGHPLVQRGFRKWKQASFRPIGK